MRCHNCGMISFRPSKKCANCNTDLKTVPQRPAADIFSVYQLPVGALEQSAVAPAPSDRFVKTMEYPADTGVETLADFDLNLSDAETFDNLAPPFSATAEKEGSIETLGEEEIEVEGLGFEFGEPSALSNLDTEEKIESPASDFDLEPELAIEETELDLNVEEPETEPSLSLDFDTRHAEEISLEVEEPEKESSISFSFNAPEAEEISLAEERKPSVSPNPLLEIPNLDLGEELELSVEPEKDPRLEIPDLDLGEEPELSIEPEKDPRLEIEDLDLTLEIEEPPPPKTETPDSSLDGFKLEIEEHPDKD